MSLRIEDYALLGDCSSAALVGRDGSIDWLCWPRFDSSACFASLLGTPDNGRFLIHPKAAVKNSSRAYRANTLILETEFETEDGAVTLVDFMPIGNDATHVARIVIGRRGTVAMQMELVVRYDYGALIPWVTKLSDGAISAVAGPDMVVLRTAAELRGEHMKTVADFTVSSGQTMSFVLSYGASHLPPPVAVDAHQQLEATEAYWNDWSHRCPEVGQWTGQVKRSLLTLKALTYAATGGIVAAPTTSLPEQLGGERNWDYRFCWLRDATLTLLALMNANYSEEAAAWRAWLQRAVAGIPADLRIMYGIAGERHLDERTLDWLPGYENSKPVRIGNGAERQVQLDIYGEIMDALHQSRKVGLPEDPQAWAVQRKMMDHLGRIWREPDAGMWEMRGGMRHFTFSKVMAWVAVDRSIRDLEALGLRGPVGRWLRLRDEIHADVCEHGFSTARGSFVQSYGSTELDATLLLIPLVGFLPPNDARVVSTIEAIQKELMRDGLVMRYNTQTAEDGFPPGEGAFLACSFWLVDVLAQQGRRDEALELFERLLKLSNDVGLFAEEYDTTAKRLVGNFPQAFSHVAMVTSAFALAPQEATIDRAEGHANVSREPTADATAPSALQTPR